MSVCPKCRTDISDTFEPSDDSCGVVGGWYCQDCDQGVAEWEVEREPLEGDVPILTHKELYGDKPLGIPLSELSGRVVPPDHHDYWKYQNWVRYLRSMGRD